MAASDALVSGATGLIPPIDTTSPLFELSLSTPAIFEDFLGVLDGSGSATAQVNIPNLPGLSGFVIHFAGATLGAGGSLTGMSNPVTITIQ